MEIPKQSLDSSNKSDPNMNSPVMEDQVDEMICGIASNTVASYSTGSNELTNNILLQNQYLECQNCIIVQKKIERCKSWLRFYREKMMNVEKIILIVAEFEREKKKNLELQLAYDQRSREWSQQQEQLITLLNEAEPLRDRLKVAEEMATLEKEKADKLSILEESMHHTVQQLEAKLTHLQSFSKPLFVETVVKKLAMSKQNTRKLRTHLEDKSNELCELKTFYKDKNIRLEKTSKMIYWALHIANLLSCSSSSNNVSSHARTRLKNHFEEAGNKMKFQYKSFRILEEKKLTGKKIEISCLPSFEEWIDDFDKVTISEEPEDEPAPSEPSSGDEYEANHLEELLNDSNIEGEAITNEEVEAIPMPTLDLPLQEKKSQLSNYSAKKRTPKKVFSMVSHEEISGTPTSERSSIKRSLFGDSSESDSEIVCSSVKKRLSRSQSTNETSSSSPFTLTSSRLKEIEKRRKKAGAALENYKAKPISAKKEKNIHEMEMTYKSLSRTWERKVNATSGPEHKAVHDRILPETMVPKNLSPLKKECLHIRKLDELLLLPEADERGSLLDDSSEDEMLKSKENSTNYKDSVDRSKVQKRRHARAGSSFEGRLNSKLLKTKNFLNREIKENLKKDMNERFIKSKMVCKLSDTISEPVEEIKEINLSEKISSVNAEKLNGSAEKYEKDLLSPKCKMIIPPTTRVLRSAHKNRSFDSASDKEEPVSLPRHRKSKTENCSKLPLHSSPIATEERKSSKEKIFRSARKNRIHDDTSDEEESVVAPQNKQISKVFGRTTPATKSANCESSELFSSPVSIGRGSQKDQLSRESGSSLETADKIMISNLMKLFDVPPINHKEMSDSGEDNPPQESPCNKLGSSYLDQLLPLSESEEELESDSELQIDIPDTVTPRNVRSEEMSLVSSPSLSMPPVFTPPVDYSNERRKAVSKDAPTSLLVDRNVQFTSTAQQIIAKEVPLMQDFHKENVDISSQSLFNQLDDLLRDLLICGNTGSKMWYNCINSILRLVPEFQPSSLKSTMMIHFVRCILGAILRSLPLTTLDFPFDISPEIFRILQLVKLAEVRLNYPPFAITAIVQSCCHKLILTRRSLKANSLASIASWFACSCFLQYSHTGPPEDEALLQYCRTFITDLLLHHKGKAHLALLATAVHSKKIFVRMVKYRAWENVERVIGWIIYHGDWEGPSLHREKLKSAWTRLFSLYKVPLENPKDIILQLLQTIIVSSNENRSIAEAGLQLLMEWYNPREMLDCIRNALKEINKGNNLVSDEDKISLASLKSIIEKRIEKVRWDENEKEKWMRRFKSLKI